MFNRKPNWRAGIVGLASLALLATFPLATVTASAETVEPTPAGTVEQVATAESPEVDLKKLSAKADAPEGVSVERAASGYNAFRFADDDLGSSPYNRQDGLWTLSLQGEVTKVQWDTNKGRYAPKESRDIPIGTRKCSNGEFKGSWDRGVFDGLAVAGKNASTMYATYSYSNATRNNVTDDLNSGTSIYRYHHGKWHAWRLRRSGGSWKILEEEVSWSGNCSSGGTVTASYSAQTSASQGAESDRNYTFDYARTNFSSGTVINAGSNDPEKPEAYIFGGSDGTRFVGTKVHSIKMFAFMPNANGGTVKYLGYLPVNRVDVPGQEAKGPQSVFADFTTDADGNVYVAVGQGYNEGVLTNPPKKLNLQVWRFPKGYIQNEIKATVPSSPNRAGRPQDGAQFDFKGRYHWGDPYNFSNSGCGANGGSSKCTTPIRVDDQAHPEWFGKRIINNNYTFTDNVDGFSGIAIAPDNHVAVGVNLSRAGGGATYGKVFEIQQNENIDNSLTKLISSSLRHNDFPTTNTNFLNQEYTDIEGVLYAPPKRTLKLSKQVSGRKDNDQFVVDLNPTGANSKTNYKINNAPDDAHKTKTSFTSANGTQAIGKEVQGQIVPTKIALPSGDFTARIGERGYLNGNITNGNKFVMTERYNTTISCSKGIEVTANKYSTPDRNRYFDIAVSQNATGDLECTLINTAVSTPTPVPSPKKRTFKFVKNLTRANPNDSFQVEMQPFTAGIGPTLQTTVSGRDGDFTIKASQTADKQEIEAGNLEVAFIERATQGSLQSYNTSLSCTDKNGLLPLSDRHVYTNDSDKWQLTATIPARAEGDIVCTLVNDKKPQPAVKTVYVHKQFDHRYNPSDNFIASVYRTFPYYEYVTVETDGTGTQNENHDFMSNPIQFPNDAIITVQESGKDGARLSNYETEITCKSGETPLTEEFSSTPGAKNFRLKSATASRVDCFVKNTAKPRLKTVHLHKMFTGFAKDTDIFKLTLSRYGVQSQVAYPNPHNMDLNVERELVKLSDIPVNGGQATQVSISEAAMNQTKLSDYTTTLKCYNGETKEPSKEITVGGTTRNWTLNVGSSNDDDIHCYMENASESRTLKVMKVFKNTTTTNGFQIRVNSEDLVSTNNHTPGQSFQVGKDFKIPATGESRLSLFEQLDTSNTYENLEDFNISVECADNQSPAHTHTITGVKNSDKTSWYTLGEKIPAEMKGVVTCTIKNEKIVQPVNTKVVLYKDLKTYNTGDQFNIGLTATGNNANSGFDIASQTAPNASQVNAGAAPTSSPIPQDYSRYKIGEISKRPEGSDFQFNITETATSGELANYNSKVTCKSVAEQSNQENDIQGATNVPLKSGSASVTIPQTQKGEVHCYLTNSPKPKAENKLVLFKQLKRVNNSDQFYFGLYNPSTGSFSTPLGGVYPKTTGSTSTTHSTVELEYDGKTVSYDQYKSDDYKYSDSENGFTFKISESRKEAPTKVSDYVSSVTCKALDAAGQWSKINVSFGEIVTNGNTRYVVATLPAHQSGEVHCYLRNEPKPKGSITIVKTSGTAKLSGSGWKIEKKQGTSWVDYGVIGDDDANQSNLDTKKGTGKYIKDAIKASTGENKGKIKISDLPVGTYRVTEILAPAGFQITEAAAAGFEITVSADSLNPSQTVVNTPAEVPELPFTGGWGTLPYMILGFVLTGGAVVAFVIAKPKNTKPSHK